MIAAGVDCGAKNTKTVIVRDGQIVGRATALTGFERRKACQESLETALAMAGVHQDSLDGVAGTGSGANAVEAATIKVNDIKAMALAAHFLFPDARTVLDVGAEEARAVKVNESGGVEDFAVNEKCAAGAGAFIEAMARALETPLEQLGPLALTSDTAIPMNAQCAIFAESEVVGLIHAKTPIKDISRAIHDSMANRIVSIVRRIGANPDIVVMGGVAYNPGFVEALKRELESDRVFVPEAPEYGAAIGAAVALARNAEQDRS